MLKWLLSLFLFVVVIGVLQPRLAAWLGLGKLPGDLRLKIRGKDYLFPFASTLLTALLGAVLFHLI